MKVQRVECKSCGCIRQEDIHFVTGKRSYTNKFARYVVDLSRIGTIKDVADGGVMAYDRVGAILNRVHSPEDIEHVDLGGIELLGWFGEVDGIRQRDIQDVPLLTMPDDDAVLDELSAAMVRFGVIGG